MTCVGRYGFRLLYGHLLGGKRVFRIELQHVPAGNTVDWNGVTVG